MKVKIQKGLNALNKAAGAVNAMQFVYQIGSGVIHWYHNKNEHHHTLQLTEEQYQHLMDGGRIEFEYSCGNTLRAGK